MNRDQDTIRLLREWHSGDRAAFDALIEQNLAWVREHVHRRLGDGLRRHGETQDFVQEAMVRILEHGPRFEISDRAHFRGLLARIVENCLCNEHRYHHRERRDARRVKAMPSDTVLSLDPPQKGVTRPSQHADKNERIAWIRLALELLRPGDREVIWLHEMEGMTFKEIADRLGLGEEGARVRFQRALPRLMAKVRSLQAGQIEPLLRDDPEVT